MVQMNHPDMPGVEIEVADTAVSFHLASGWRVAEAAPVQEKAVADEGSADDSTDGDKASARSSKSTGKES